LNSLNDKQRGQFAEFSEKFDLAYSDAIKENSLLEQDVPDNPTRLRFLQAEDYKVDFAVKRLIECLSWRVEYGVVKLLSEGPPPVYEQYQTQRIIRQIGVDKEGHPIMAERFGETMSMKNLQVMPIEDWIKCIVYDTELLCKTLRETSKEHGKPIHKVLNIYDLKGISLIESTRNVSFLKQIDRTLSANYPELVSVILVVNAPSFVSGLYNNVVKHFLDPVTVAKIRIHSSASPGLFEEFADIRQLPEEYGGENGFGADYPHRTILK